MKLTKTKLKQIIKEEIKKVLSEAELKELGPVGHYAETGRLKPSQGDMETKSKCEKLLMRLRHAKEDLEGETAPRSHDEVAMEAFALRRVRDLEQELADLGCHEDGA